MTEISTADRDRLLEHFGRRYANGDVIFREGDHSREVFMLQEGRVRVVKRVRAVERSIQILKPGDLFGEGALLPGTQQGTPPRSRSRTWWCWRSTPTPSTPSCRAPGRSRRGSSSSSFDASATPKTRSRTCCSRTTSPRWSTPCCASLRRRAAPRAARRCRSLRWSLGPIGAQCRHRQANGAPTARGAVHPHRRREGRHRRPRRASATVHAPRDERADPIVRSPQSLRDAQGRDDPVRGVSADHSSCAVAASAERPGESNFGLTVRWPVS